ncbi:MAG: cellulase family glycosylhydrolase [Treponema sp.]|nr:cellulase family glycosylhydrolase [Treponema sp.]
MRIFDNRFLDEEGRTLILRGLNLGGSSKNPMGPPGAAFPAESLKNPGGVSFVGRPFPLEDADAHLSGLVRAGFTFLRLVITWEALEHQGPGVYDEAYLAYLRKILLAAEKWGISVFIDPHQDVWSRWTGGDGAPAWTLEKLGMDLERLDLSGAAITRQRYAEFHGGRPFPKMAWPGNYNRYAAATLFTLFFAGNVYAPDLMIEGERVQDWLQGHYIAALRHCYRRLKNSAAIAGWGTMNEPHHGFIGHQDLSRPENPVVPLGPNPSPFQTMTAASGHRTEIAVYGIGLTGKPRPRGREILNPGEVPLFREGYCCPWKQAGVWASEDGGPRLLKKDHFARYQNRPVCFADDFLKPFMIRFIEKMRETSEKTFFFIEGVPREGYPSWQEPRNTVHAFHWYDGFALYTKIFRPWFSIRTDTARPVFGHDRVTGYFRQALAEGISWTREHMGNMPCLLGEFGLPFDLNGRRAYKTGDYSVHEEALSMYYDAIDANLLHSTLWNYTADNTIRTGDGWNDEDLSIFSGGKERAAGGWKRPYPMASAGIPLSFKWDRKKGIFTYRFKTDGKIPAPTEIFLPEEFGTAPEISVVPADSGKIHWEYRPEKQRLFLWNEGWEGELSLTVKK